MRKRPLGSKPVPHVQDSDVQLDGENTAVQVATLQVSKKESPCMEVDQQRAPTGCWPVRCGDIAPHGNFIAIPSGDREVRYLD